MTVSISIPNISALEEALMTAFDGVAVLVDGCYVWLNEMHSKMYGFSMEESLGKSWTMLYDDAEISRIEREVFPVLQDNGSWKGICLGRHKNGQKFEVELSLRICPTGEMVCCCRDISPILRAERAQRQLATFLGGMTCLIQAAIDSRDLTLFITRMLRLVADNLPQVEVLLFVPGSVLKGIVPAQSVCPPPSKSRTNDTPMNHYRIERHPDVTLPDLPHALSAGALLTAERWAREHFSCINERIVLEHSPIMRSTEALGLVLLGHDGKDATLKYGLLKFLDPVVSAVATILLNAVAHKHNAEILERQERLAHDFNLMARNAGVMVWRWNLASGQVVSNEKDTQERLWGEALEWAYQHFEMIVHEDRERVQRGMEQLQKQEISVFDAEYAILTACGERKIVRSLALFLPSEGGAEEIQGITYDVTESHELNSRLRDSENNYRKLFEWMPDGLLLAVKPKEAGDFRVVEINNAMRGMMNISFSAPCERLKLAEVLPPSILEVLDQSCASTESGHSILTRDVEILSYGELTRYVRLVISRDSNPELTEKLFLRAVDIDAQRRREIELQRISELNQASSDELRRVTRLKDEFLANMSHELRTPLNGILGACEILEDGVMGTLLPKQLEMIEICKSSGSHLLGIINDILDLSKIDAGKMQIDTVPITVGTLCDEVCKLTLTLAHQAGIKIELQLNDTADTVISVDRVRFRQALLNLLANAIKYSSPGSVVKLFCSWNRIYHTVQFDVIDTGMGIDMRKVSGLFLPFEQVSTGLNRSHEGTGLGLTLVKKLAQLHLGHVVVASKPGRGSRFSIVVPDINGTELLRNYDSKIERSKLMNDSVTTGIRAIVVDSVEARMQLLVNTLDSMGCPAVGFMSISDLPSALLAHRPRYALIEVGRELDAFSQIYSTHKEGLESLVGVVAVCDFILQDSTLNLRELYDLTIDVSGVVAQPFSSEMLDLILQKT